MTSVVLLQKNPHVAGAIWTDAKQPDLYLEACMQVQKQKLIIHTFTGYSIFCTSGIFKCDLH